MKEQGRRVDAHRPGRLKSFGLIEYDSGMVKARPLLFLE